MNTGILCLGTRRDAPVWEQQCKALGLDAALPIKVSQPTLAQVKAFFTRPADWIYFGGHSLGDELYNEAHNVSLHFKADQVEIQVGDQKASVAKGSDDFKLDGRVKLVLWAGCSTLWGKDLVANLNALFGPHVMLGFRRMTGPEMVEAMFTGGGFIKQPFFARVAGKLNDSAACRDAWLGAALEGYGGSENEDRFAAIDPDGREWTLVNKAIKSGRMMF